MQILDFDINQLPTPYYIVDENLLRKNLEILRQVHDRTNCTILLAQKAFSMFYFYPLIGEYLQGTTASGLFESRLGHEKMHLENHIFSPAYKKNEFDEILAICDHIVFNSFSQWQAFQPLALASNRTFGMRINPECSTQDHDMYDPCGYGSRLGVPRKNFREDLLEGISGLHFHTLCEQNSDALKETLEAVEANFGSILPQMKWLNFGGGHHITRSDYDVETLIESIQYMQNKYNLSIYLEPGEAVALNTGYLVATVVDIFENDLPIAILDTSAACHMPDVLEMPYRPPVLNSGLANEKAFTFRLGGPTCLAGDVIGDYSFDQPLKIDDRIIFEDMAHYTMVKNNTFNGIPLPSIAIVDQKRNIKTIRSFDYSDFESRL